MYKVTISDETSFTIGEGQSLVDGGIIAGVNIPYSCKSGRCGVCKCRVLSGQTKVLIPEVGLPEEDMANGWILGCARSATSELVVEAEVFHGVDIAKPVTVPCKIDGLQLLSRDVISVTLRFPPSIKFAFLAGQYVDIIGPNQVRRSYSVASGDASNGRIELHIRSVSGGSMSEYWFGRAKINDTLRLHGPLGTFFVRNAPQLDIIFLATGTGMAPVKSMLERLYRGQAEYSPASVSVYWGARNLEDLYLSPTIFDGAFRYVPVLSRADATWDGRRGYVQDACIEDGHDLSRAIVYACGSETMIERARRVLMEAGLSEKRFVSDAFVPSS